jgi:quercetin dioxygenase-like cupin family protein
MRAVLIAAAIGVCGLLAPGAPAGAAPDPAVLAYKLPDQIPWTRESQMGSRIYVLWGDPTKPGPYAMLVMWEPHHFSQPHTHPNARYVTVLSGTWWVGTGKTFSTETTTPLPAGTTVIHFAKQWHYDGAKDEPAVLEIVGEGPQ